MFVETKDRLDKENLGKALELNRDILNHIDASIHNRNQELRLLEIYSKMDARSTAIYDKIKKFKVCNGLNSKVWSKNFLSDDLRCLLTLHICHIP